MTGERSYSGLRFWVLFLGGLSSAVFGMMLIDIILHAYNPMNVEVELLFPLFYMFAGTLIASGVLALLWFMLRYPAMRKTILILLLITTGVLVAHFYTINEPPTSSCYDSQKGVDGCVMDEIYYVPAAQALLTGEKCGPYADNCNLEHPFLSKAFIAAGIVLFGNNDFGWRFFVVLLGTASIPILFAICWRVTRDSTLSLFAAFLLAFETLFFTQSSIAVIDVQAVFFALLAFLAYFGDLHIWKFNKYVVSGVFMGLAALSKETAIFLALTLAAYILFFEGMGRRSRLLWSVAVFAITAAVFIIGLQLYVTLFGDATTRTFVADISYIISYGGSLKGSGWIDSVLGTPITPLNWITYYSSVGYFVTRVTINGTYTYVSLGYWGVANFFEVWLTFLWAPYVLYLGYKRWRLGRIAKRSSLVAPELTQPVEASPPQVVAPAPDPSFKLAGFALLWFALTYFPYIAIYFYGRVTYPFYFIPSIPAVAIGCAYLLTRKWFPREVAYIILGGVFLWFFLYYPDKSFLPTWVRMILGH